MQKINSIIIAALIMLVGGFAIYLWQADRSDEFRQFTLDRKEGAGQTQPDPRAACKYSVDGQNLVVERKAHGQVVEVDHVLSGTFIETVTQEQQGIIATSEKIYAYNCINGDLVALSRPGPADVLFSDSGRNVVVVTKDDGQSEIHVLTFKIDEGQTVWDTNFGPASEGIAGEILDVQINGESLVAVLSGESENILVHTYNFRSSHEDTPWNEHDLGSNPLEINGPLVEPVNFIDRGKQVTVNEYFYKFNCGSEETSCVWTTR